MEKVSVIIPIYNAEKTIEKTINSIINQTYEELEIICINDGSTDETEKILRRIEDKDNRVKVIYQKNAGVSKARNTGIDNASGKFICFIDADDYIQNDYIKECINILRVEKSDLLCTSYMEGNKKISVEEKFIQHLDKKKIEEQILTSNYFNTVWAQILKANIIKENKLRFNENIIYGEDLLFNWDFITHAQKITYIDFPGYIYIYNQNGITQSSDIEKVLKKIKDTFNVYKRFCRKENEEQVKNIILNKLNLNVRRLILNNKKITYKQITEMLKKVEKEKEEMKVKKIYKKCKRGNILDRICLKFLNNNNIEIYFYITKLERYLRIIKEKI